MKRLYIFLAFLVLAKISLVQAQTLQVKGTVTGAEDGLPIPGVTVVVKGTTNGIFTTVDGKYELKVAADAQTLTFSFVGFKTQDVAIGGRAIIDVVLESQSLQVEEVVVTAIGIKSEKKSLGYAAQEVKGDDVSNANQANIVNALSSKVAGINVTSSSGTPGASSKITIRGVSSLRGDKQSPLFVVDGVPIDNSYAGADQLDYSNRAIDLNSDDVESVSVLKGAAAAALYGIRAANGAILVTTKTGKKKGAIKKNITFKTTMSFDKVNKLPEMQDKYSQGVNGIYSSTSMNSWGALIDTLRYDGATDNLKDKNGNIVGMHDKNATDQRVIPYDNLKDFFQIGITNNTYLSMSGGSDVGNYFFSFGRLNQSGVVPKTDFKRISFKLAGDSKLSEKLKISGSANYTNSNAGIAQKGSNKSAVMVGLLRCTPTFDLSNGSTDPVNDPTAYALPDGTQRMYYFDYDNPYWSVNKNRAFDKVNRIMGNSQVDYSIAPWLNAMYRVGIDFYTEQRNYFFDNNSTDTKDGFVQNSVYNFSGVNSDFLITAEKNITKDLKFSTSLGHNYYTKTTYDNYQQGNAFILPDFYDMSNTASIKESDDKVTRYKIVGVYYDVKLAYKNFLFLNTTGRNDWTSTLAKGNNSFFYPSVNASFIFTEAFNINKNSIFNFGKIRASWAQVGNDADVYSLSDYYVTGGIINGQTSFATQSTIGNKNIKPETTNSSEIGLDLRFFQNKLGIDLAVYESKSIGQILEIPVPFSSGYRKMVSNSGIVTNKGIEAQIFITPIKTHDFTWDFMANFAKNKNMVEDLPDDVPFLETTNAVLASTRSIAMEGYPYGVLYGTRFLRNDKGQILVYDSGPNKGYPIKDNELGVVGDPNPDFTLGLRNTFTYKVFTFSALIDITHGNDVANVTKNAMNYFGTSKFSENRDQDYIVPGVYQSGEPNTTVIKRNAYYYSPWNIGGLSELSIEDGSFVRLREVSFSINLPSKWFKRTPINGVNFGISGRNLMLFTKYTGIDPETNLSGAATGLGRDYFNMPNTKGYEFNLQVTF